MRREEVFHARAAARAAGVRRVLVVGSQAVLGSHHEDELPDDVLASVEADIVVLDDLDGTAHHSVEAALGYMSVFHTTHGYYAERVEPGTAVLPEGWEGRVLTLHVPAVDGDDVAVHFPELHDLSVSKLVAGCPKDRSFVAALANAGLLDIETLVERAHRTSSAHPDLDKRTVALAEAMRGPASGS